MLDEKKSHSPAFIHQTISFLLRLLWRWASDFQSAGHEFESFRELEFLFFNELANLLVLDQLLKWVYRKYVHGPEMNFLVVEINAATSILNLITFKSS